MKIIIDISEEQYKWLDFYLDYYQGINQPIFKAIKNGTILPKNPTNGDMIKAIFPNIQTRNKNTDFITYSLDGIVGTCVETKWWNAPYERKADEDSD